MNCFSDNNFKADILVVDDTLANLRLLVSLLRGKGYKVRPVTDGYSALESIQKSHPDLILLDILMPKLSGYEVCERLKADPQTREIPIIFLSALSEGGDKAKAFVVGGADYISKPYQMEEVLARIENQLLIQSQKQQLQKEILERQQAEEALRSQYLREQAINHLIRAIRNSLELSTIFSTAVTEVGKFLQTDWAGILQHFQDEERWQVVAQYLPNSNFLNLLKQRENSELAKVKYLEVFYLPEIDKIIDSLDLDIAQQYPRIWLPIPVYSNQQLWGCLCLVRHRSIPWAESEVQLARTVADQLAIAIEQAQLYSQLQQANQELERLVHIDGLTEVANRRLFDRVIKQEWLRMRREQLPLSLILCDIDYFKHYNDTYGHLAGDDCLRQIAVAIRSAVKRPADLVARYGGEEFAVLLPNTPAQGALQVAELILQQVQQLQLPHVSSPVSEYLTLSLGVSTIVPSLDGLPEELIKFADEALYEAKRRGRNGVVIQTE